MMSRYDTSYTSYPIKIVCRTASVSRLRKIRASWFVVGVAFSLGCTSALTPIFSTTEIVTATQQPLSDAESKPVVPLEEIIGAAPAEFTPQAEVIPQETVTSEAELPEVAPAIAPENPKQLVTLKIKKGDTLVGMLTDAGIATEDAANAFATLRTVFNPRRLDIGSSISVETSRDNNGNVVINELKLPVSALSTVELSRTGDGQFSVRKVNEPITKKLVRAGGEIDSSIYQAGADSGIPSTMLNEIINAYSYDVDFQRDIKKGDSIDVLFERMETDSGAVAANGNLVFAELALGDRTLKIYRYTDKDGNADFYNEKGESVRKALLRTPISGARVTSGYGLREHPISGYTKMHRGVDFGAPIGTPIYAAGDGIVAAASRRSGYGNYIKLKHNDRYASAYAHLSRFAGGISIGKPVKQGQIIGYVGMTGATTGPHLHYEILANNEQVNPANIKFKTGNVLHGKELTSFRNNISKIEDKLASIGRGDTVAMTDSDKKELTN